METCSEDKNELHMVGLLGIVISLISLILSLISVLTYFILPNIKKNNAIRLIGYLLVSNAFSSIGRVSSIVAGDSSVITIPSLWDYILSISYIFGFQSGINLTLIFSLNLYFEVYYKKSLVKFEKLIIFSCFGIAGVAAFLTATTTIILKSLPLIIITSIYIISVMTITIGLYIKVILAFTKVDYHEAMQCMKDLAIYPLVSIVMMILFFSQQILIIVQGCYSTYYWILFGIRGLQGFIDVIIYGFNTTVRAEIYKKFHRYSISDDSNKDQFISKLIENNDIL